MDLSHNLISLKVIISKQEFIKNNIIKAFNKN